VANIVHYDVGDLWVPQATFTVSGTPTDPTTLTVRQQDSAGVETILANAVNAAALGTNSTPVARVSAGVFKLNPGVSLTSSGYWFTKFEGTGAASATETQEAIVDPDEFSNGLDTRALANLSETKAWLRQVNQDTDDDLLIVSLINAASNTIHEVAQREFKVVGTNPQTRDFDLEEWVWYADRTVPVGDMTSVTSASIISYGFDGTVADTTPLTNTVTFPRNRKPWQPIASLQFPLAVIPPFLLYRPVLRVVGSWGFPQVPAEIKQACMDTVAYWIERDVEHYTQDLGIQTTETAGTVIIGRGQYPTKILPLPPEVHSRVAQYQPTVLV
jgi:hypothetical protein